MPWPEVDRYALLALLPIRQRSLFPFSRTSSCDFFWVLILSFYTCVYYFHDREKRALRLIKFVSCSKKKGPWDSRLRVLEYVNASTSLNWSSMLFAMRRRRRWKVIACKDGGDLFCRLGNLRRHFFFPLIATACRWGKRKLFRTKHSWVRTEEHK